MNSISLSLQFVTLCQASTPIKAKPGSKAPPLDGLVHLVLAIALAIFGSAAAYVGSSILLTTGWSTPAGILLLSCGLIMLGIGLPARIASIQKIWQVEKD